MNPGYAQYILSVEFVWYLEASSHREKRVERAESKREMWCWQWREPLWESVTSHVSSGVVSSETVKHVRSSDQYELMIESCPQWTWPRTMIPRWMTMKREIPWYPWYVLVIVMQLPSKMTNKKVKTEFISVCWTWFVVSVVVDVLPGLESPPPCSGDAGVQVRRNFLWYTLDLPHLLHHPPHLTLPRVQHDPGQAVPGPDERGWRSVEDGGHQDQLPASEVPSGEPEDRERGGVPSGQCQHPGTKKLS